MDRSKGKWYVVNTLSGQENKVRKAIERLIEQDGESSGIYEVLVPSEMVTQVKDGRKLSHERKFYPGYIMVRLDLYDDAKKLRENTWFSVRDLQGVIGFVGVGDKPMPLSAREVAELMAMMEAPAEKVRPVVAYNVGEIVRIKEGAFENFEGTIEGVDADRGKLKIMVSIFGRLTPVELEFGQVERV